MTTDECTAYVAAIVSSLAETTGQPESMLYIVCGTDLDKWNTIKRILVSSRWIQIRNHYVTLTDSGRQIAAKIDAALAHKD